MSASGFQPSASFWGSVAALPWKRIGLSALCIVLALVLIVMIFVTAYVEKLLGSIERIDPDETQSPTLSYSQSTDPSASVTTEPPLPTIPGFTEPTAPNTIIAHEDIVNIMLIGQDRRPGDGGRTNSDAMILCTFNKRNGTFTMTSFMRDLYVNVPGYGMSKLNSAYPRGGMNLLSQTLLENFGVKVDSFMEVDFNGFKGVVNAIGGVDIYLNAAEAEYLNTQVLDGIDYSGWNLKEGMNHLDGDQALAYSRIRKVGMWDYERTERQRKVLTAILGQCKYLNLSQAFNLLNELLPLVRTNMTNSEITNYAMELFPIITGGSMVTQRIPIDGSYQDTGEIIIPDYALNHDFLVNSLLPS